jgi:ferric-dicitrate binding protein FerR (iron transport regulator)
MIDDSAERTTRLLRLGEPRPGGPEDRAARVRKVVHAEWHHELRRRNVRRHLAMGTLVMASAAAVVLAARAWPAPEPISAVPAEALAFVERIDGGTGLSRGEAITAGRWIETGADARLAARLGSGVSVRIDANSRVRLLSTSVVELASGGVYLDTNDTGTPLEVRTPLGVAHDVGTQFEVRLEPAALRVRVRTGLVEVRSGGRAMAARPGTELTLSPEHARVKPITVYGPEWRWMAQLAPMFEIEGRPLGAFLDHLSREQGWTVRYADARLEREASDGILHGSVAGLAPDDALGVAMRISGLTYRFSDGVVTVTRASGGH